MAGNPVATNAPTLRQAGAWAPLIAARARASRVDSMAVRPAAAQLGQVRGHPLIAADQLVDLRARQPPPAPHQVVEAIPLGLVRGDERVYVHPRRLPPGIGTLGPGPCRAAPGQEAP